MPILNRLLTLCVLASACVMSSTAVFAIEQHEAAASSSNAVVSKVTEKTDPSLAPEIDFGSLFTPKPTNRSCTANSDCSVTGGSPVACTGVTTCISGAAFAECDGVFTYCACVPANVPPTCRDPQGFCACYNASPSQIVTCLRAHCAP